MTQITKKHLDFVQRAKEAFENNPVYETYADHDLDLIALRMGEDRDCVEVWSLDSYVANFVQQVKPLPNPRKTVMLFAHDMEAQLKVNDFKGGWDSAHYVYLPLQIDVNWQRLIKELNKEDKDKYEITILCANIANYAMMVADNEGEHL